jgi:thymidylate synthase ThyX
MTSPHDAFSAEERAILARHFTDLDGPVFALVDMPDVVKGALFARYSRSPKSLRRLYLDEFHDGAPADAEVPAHLRAADGVARAEKLYERVLVEYGDDSVAQLVGAHIAVEDASNVLTKVLEWGRLMSYLEQSTRYIPYNERPGGRWRYHLPAEIAGTPLERSFVAAMDACFETYTAWFERLQDHLRDRFPRQPGDSASVWRQSIRAKACDVLRGLLPAATTANVGLFGSAQAFEQLLLRLQSHPLAEARAAGEAILRELRKTIPVFMRRVDQPDRGAAWSRYLRDTADAMAAAAPPMSPDSVTGGPSVALTRFDTDGEARVVAAALYPHVSASDAAILERVRPLTDAERASLLETYVGRRTNRRHKPGRAFEATSYRFDIVADYGAFRDLQRHRLLTIDWQPLSPGLGYDVPSEIMELDGEADWRRVMEVCASLHQRLCDSGLHTVAPYALPMAYRIRFYMEMNAREAMHLIELRTTPQGHPAYRWVGREMLRLIDEVAGHHEIARAMRFAGRAEDDADLERLASERASERKRLSVEKHV